MRQLLEYKKYKERAMLLQRRIEERTRRHERPEIPLGGEDLSDAGPLQFGNVSVWDLLTAFHRIQIALGQRVPHRVLLQDRPIEEYIALVESHLSGVPGRTAQFEDLFGGARGDYVNAPKVHRANVVARERGDARPCHPGCLRTRLSLRVMADVLRSLDVFFETEAAHDRRAFTLMAT